MSFYSDIWGCNFIWPVRFSWWWCSVAKSDSLWPHGLPACQASLSFTVCQSCLKLMSIESVMPSNHLILCCPFILLPSIFPRIRVFSNELALDIRWPKYWNFTFSISPSNVRLMLSFKTDWFYLLAVQGTLKSLLQHHKSKASIFHCSLFFMVQLSDITTGKNHSLSYQLKILSTGQYYHLTSLNCP